MTWIVSKPEKAHDTKGRKFLFNIWRILCQPIAAIYLVSEEYLLGSRILVAPVIVEGAISRDIIIPDGTWKDGNSGNIIQGPTKIRDYNAPIDILPYFIKQ